MRKPLLLNLILVIFLLYWCGLKWNQEQQYPPSTHPHVEEILEYKSPNTFNFTYPEKICDDSTKKCYPITLLENPWIITLDAWEGGSFRIYYGLNISDEKSANQFLQTTLKNNLCKITETHLIPETQIKSIFFDSGCSLYGPDYEEYSSNHPDAISLSGKVWWYWSINTGELIIFEYARGGGCAFVDCKSEFTIWNSINLAWISLGE